MAPPLHKSIQKPERFAELVNAYVNSCLVKDDQGKDTLITIAGLALHLGCHKGQISEWHNKYEKPTKHDPSCLIADSIKRAKQVSENQLQQDCYRNRNTMSLALAKCMFGYVEQQHVKHEHSGGVNIVVQSNIPGPLSTKAGDKG